MKKKIKVIYVCWKSSTPKTFSYKDKSPCCFLLCLERIISLQNATTLVQHVSQVHFHGSMPMLGTFFFVSIGICCHSFCSFLILMFLAFRLFLSAFPQSLLLLLGLKVALYLTTIVCFIHMYTSYNIQLVVTICAGA